MYASFQRVATGAALSRRAGMHAAAAARRKNGRQDRSMAVKEGWASRVPDAGVVHPHHPSSLSPPLLLPRQQQRTADPCPFPSEKFEMNARPHPHRRPGPGNQATAHAGPRRAARTRPYPIRSRAGWCCLPTHDTTQTAESRPGTSPTHGTSAHVHVYP